MKNRRKLSTIVLSTALTIFSILSLTGCSYAAGELLQILEQQVEIDQATLNETEIVEEAPDYVNQGEIVAFTEDGDPIYSYENGEFLDESEAEEALEESGNDELLIDSENSETFSEGTDISDENVVPENEDSEFTAENTESKKQDADEAKEDANSKAQDGVDRTDPNYVEYRFRSKKLLNQHYEKHGIEMGFDSKEEYQAAASDVINNPKALTKTEKEDGDYVYYVEDTNEFVILSLDGYIRTYFLPNGGKKYFDRQ